MLNDGSRPVSFIRKGRRGADYGFFQFRSWTPSPCSPATRDLYATGGQRLEVQESAFKKRCFLFDFLREISAETNQTSLRRVGFFLVLTSNNDLPVPR